MDCKNTTFSVKWKWADKYIIVSLQHKRKHTMPNSQMTYTDAYQELQEIVQKMENADISVDELAQKIKRASQLIQICKDKLTKTEEEINQLIEKK